MASSPALSSSYSSNLLEILRRANARYSRIAATLRLSIHPTHHARKRATALKLTVSIQKALKLDPKQISTIPLPVIDRAISPPTELSKAVVGRERELARTGRPLLKYTIPSPSSTLLRPQKMPQDQYLTSRWSMSPIEADSDVAQELPEGIAITCNPNDDHDMVLCSPTESGESVRFMVKLPPQLNLSPPSNNYSDIPLPDFTRPLSWVSDISSLGSSSSDSGDTTSSRGPITPVRLYLTDLRLILLKLLPDSTTQMAQRNPQFESNASRQKWTTIRSRNAPRSTKKKTFTTFWFYLTNLFAT